jgi:hypothetical protein
MARNLFIPGQYRVQADDSFPVINASLNFTILQFYVARTFKDLQADVATNPNLFI